MEWIKRMKIKLITQISKKMEKNENKPAGRLPMCLRTSPRWWSTGELHTWPGYSIWPLAKFYQIFCKLHTWYLISDQDTQFDHWQSFMKYFGEFASGDCGLGDVCTAYVPDLPMIRADTGAAELCRGEYLSKKIWNIHSGVFWNCLACSTRKSKNRLIE